MLLGVIRRVAVLRSLPVLKQSAAGLSTEVRRAAAGVTVAEDGKKMSASWDPESGRDSHAYHSVWLRRNCQCPKCLNPQNQNVVLSYELDPQVTVHEAVISLDGSEVKMKWSCGHEGYINLDWLRKNNYSTKTLDEGRKNAAPLFVTQSTLPRMQYNELEDEYGIWKWLKYVNEYGICLLHGVPCSVDGSIEVSQKICPYFQDNMYGGISELIADPSPFSAAYGPNAMEPHMDVPMYESHVGITLIHCLSKDKCVSGGDGIIVDGLAAAEKLRVTHPHHFATLVRVPATFHRIDYSRAHPVHMVYRTPHIHLNGHGQIIKFRWAPHHEGPLQVSEEDVEPFYEAYTCLSKLITFDKELRVYHRLEAGDMFTLNNQRMLHGRTKIELNGGTRHLTNIAMNIDEFKSRFHYLCNKFAPDYQPRNALNQDFSFSTK